MKIELDRLEFLKAWQMTERSSSTKSTISAVSGILITASEEETYLEATDFKTAIRCSAQGIRTVTAGSAVLPVRIFGEFLKKTPHDKVSLEIDDERGTLSAGRNRTRFATWPVSEFPNIPRSDGADPLCTIVAADLARAISEGSVASSTPADFPKYLGACLLKAQRDLLKIVATDGKRLSLSQCPCEAGAEIDLLLPIPALKELVRLLMGNAPESRIDVLYDGSTVWFRLEGLEFSARRVESSFPNYEKILTPGASTTLRIQRDELLPALERIDIMVRNTLTRLVVFHLSPGGEFRLTGRAPELGTTTEVLDSNIDGDPLRVGFNVGFLQDGLKALGSGEIRMDFNGGEGQTRLLREGSEDFLYMLMPTRLSPQDLMEDEEAEAGPGQEPLQALAELASEPDRSPEEEGEPF